MESQVWPGTWNPTDVVIDFSNTVKTFEFAGVNGYVHAGIWAAAQALLVEQKTNLEALVTRVRGGAGSNRNGKGACW